MTSQPTFNFPTITLLSLLLLFQYSCVPEVKKPAKTDSIIVIKTTGNVISFDSLAAPKVVVVNEKILKKIPLGELKVIQTNTNVHLAGKPKVTMAGTPRICTPGKGTFKLPKTIPVIDSPFVAGIPEVVIAKDASSRDQNPHNFSTFGKLQGLKHGNVTCMLEDRSGNLWFGTGEGVSRFDGKSFTHFTQDEGMSHNVVESMLEDRYGNLWFGTAEGVTKFDGQSFTHYTQKQGLGYNFIKSIMEDRSGNLWFGTGGGGVSVFNGKSFTNYTEKEGLPHDIVTCMLEDSAGIVWLGTWGGGLCKFDGQSFAHFTEKEGLGNNAVTSLFKDISGNLWCGTLGGGVSMFDGQSFTNYTEQEGLSNNNVIRVLEDHAGNLWFGTIGGGVSKFDGHSFTHFTEKEGLSNDVFSILEDRSGNLWFGTFVDGVSTYGGKTLTHYTKNEGLCNNNVLSILEDRSGKLWFGTDEGLVKFDGQSFTHMTNKNGLSSNRILSILEDRAGNFWFGTEGGGVSRFDGKVFTHFTEKEGLNSNNVFYLMEDRSGNVWLIDGGLSRYDGKSFTRYSKNQGLNYENVSCMLEDRAGNLWFGTWNQGLYKFDGKSFTHFDVNDQPHNNAIHSMLEDQDGNLWIGSETGGVARFDGNSFIHITQNEGLINNRVVSILEDQSRNLWFGTDLGLSKLSRTSLSVLLHKARSNSSTATDVFFENYTYDNGFLGIGCNLNALLQAQDGTIWIGTNDRLTAYHPPSGVETPSVNAPNVQITDLRLFNEKMDWAYLQRNRNSSFVLGNGVKVRLPKFKELSKWYALPQGLSLSYNNNFLTFSFIGITMHQPGRIKYQYKLEGLDQNWSTLTHHTEAPYGNLPPGTFTFKVKAMNSLEVWSPATTYPFTIRPPWWKTWWAYGAYLLLLAVAGWRIHLYQRERTIKKEREKAQARELEQAKEIEKAYTQLKATQAQLIQSEKLASLGELTAGIAHEIQNPLNFVNNFSELSIELATDLKDEIKKPEKDWDLIEDLATDLSANQEKINHHGKRASAIVKGMLEHSRASTGTKELTDLNTLADEYLRLAYHGLRAKDSRFNATMETHFDPNLPLIWVIPQDIGRVLLNLINNAFYAVAERSRSTVTERSRSTVNDKSKLGIEGYEPLVSVSTERRRNGAKAEFIEIRVKDNGNGIPAAICEKIFQPFFTTKPTGQGTGLGLSLAYDIVVKGHGGNLEVESKEGEATEFIVLLPC